MQGISGAQNGFLRRIHELDSNGFIQGTGWEPGRITKDAVVVGVLGKAWRYLFFFSSAPDLGLHVLVLLHCVVTIAKVAESRNDVAV